MNWRSYAEFTLRCRGQSPAVCAEMSRRWFVNRAKREAATKAKLLATEQRRKDRVKAARTLGRHTRGEWLALVAACGGACVQCRRKPVEHRNLWLTKDHITPLAHGGSDAIENIQPMCQDCNAIKRASSSEDLRPTGWREAIR